MKALNKIQEELANQKQDIKTMEQNIKDAINSKFQEKFNAIELKSNELEKRIDVQQNTIDNLEKLTRKKNVIFFGIEERERNYYELQNSILDIINNSMGIQCQKFEIESVRRLGKKIAKPRPVIVTLTTQWKKIEILRKRKVLDSQNFYVKEDFPPKVQQTRKLLQEEVELQRSLGNNVVLRYDKIINLKNKKSTSLHTRNSNDTENAEYTHKENTRANKRNLSSSPENNKEIKESNNKKPENLKQVAKKNKTNSIASYMTKPTISEGLHSVVE